MSVIAELSLPATEFQLGRILSTEGDTTITLETMVPMGGRSVPFFRLHGSAEDDFERRVRDHPSVSDLQIVNRHGDEVLCSLDWKMDEDGFLAITLEQGGHLLDATGDAEDWSFQIRFPTHGSFSEFQESCFEADIPLDVQKIYNPTKPDAGPWYGLTNSQRDTLNYAVEMGYYSLPRRISTQDIASEFDVSDQAVTERLRRAIQTLVENSLLLTSEDEDGSSPLEAGDDGAQDL